MSWVCKYCSTNNEDGDKKCMVCDREKSEPRTCTLTKTRADALRLTGNVVIPSDYNVIGEGAFRGRTDIYSVTLPAEVTKIGKEAFYGCTNLTSVRAPAPLASIGVRAFYNCRALSYHARPSARYVSDDAFGADAPRPAYTPPPASSGTASASYTPRRTTAYTPPPATPSYTPRPTPPEPPRRSRRESGFTPKKILKIIGWGFVTLAAVFMLVVFCSQLFC